jgi:RNA polymerase sigma factor (sigma-70 family)
VHRKNRQAREKSLAVGAFGRLSETDAGFIEGVVAGAEHLDSGPIAVSKSRPRHWLKQRAAPDLKEQADRGYARMSATAVETAAVETTAVKTSILRSAVGLQSDGRLVDLVRAGSTTAYEAVVQRYRLPLVRYCSRIVGPDHAEDVVQDTFTRAHASLMGDDRPMSLKPWLYRIAHNLSLNTLRAKAWNHEELDESFDGVRQPHEHVEQKDRLRDVVARVTALPQRQRAALILQAVEGRSSEEIARELDGTVGDVRMLVHRARTRLRDAVGALIPLPLLLSWLKRGSTTVSRPAGGLLKVASGSLAKTGAIALTGLAAAGGVVLAERGGSDGQAGSKHATRFSPTLEHGAAGSASAHTLRSEAKVDDRSRKLSGPASRTRPDGNGSPSAVDGGDGKAGSTPPASKGGGKDSRADGSAPAPAPPAQSPGQDADSAAGSESSGGGGGGSTGGGSGGGSNGSGSGGGSDGLCVGPVAQLPPICLPPLGGGGSGGGGLLP